MEQPKDLEAPPAQTVKPVVSNPADGHDALSKLSGDARERAPETDYSSKAVNKTSFAAYLVNLLRLIQNLYDF